MKKIKPLWLFCLFLSTVTPVFSQVKVEIQSDSSSVAFKNVNREVILDANGAEITYEEQELFLNANEKYRRAIRIEGDDLIIYVEKIVPEKEEVVGLSLPTLTYADINGEEVKIIDGEKPCLLNFWDITCGNCIAELIIINGIAPEFPEFQIIAITSGGQDEIRKFMEARKISWSNITVVTDYKNDFQPIIQSQVYPTSVLVSESGVIKSIYFGAKLRQMILDMDSMADPKNE